MTYDEQKLIELAGRFRLINEILKSEQIADDICTFIHMGRQIRELEEICEQQKKEIADLIDYNTKLRKNNENNSI